MYGKKLSSKLAKNIKQGLPNTNMPIQFEQSLDRRSLTYTSKLPNIYLTWVLDRYVGIARMKSENKDHYLYKAVPDLVACCNTKRSVYLSKPINTKKSLQAQKTLESILKNVMKGINLGTEMKLKLNGVGYKARIDTGKLVLDAGFSHSISIPIPPDIKVSMPDNTTIVLFSIDKDRVGSFAAMLRGVRPPEPYKGKGIQYVNETVRLKSGKSKR